MSELCLDQEEIYISVLPCTVPIFKSSVTTQYVSVAHIRSDVFIIMLHHASKFEIAILFHTSLAEGTPVWQRLLINSDEQEYPWARHVHSRWYIFIQSLSVTPLGYMAVWECFIHQIAPPDRSVPRYIVQIRSFIGSPCYVGWGRVWRQLVQQSRRRNVVTQMVP